MSHEEYVLYLSKFLVLAALIAVTFALGFIARIFFMKTLLSLGDKLLHKIPIVNTVYRTTQDIIKTLFVSNKNSFKKVVMVPFPREGMYMLGLVVRESPPICAETAHENLISVLIPTTPNPTTGFLVMVKESDIKYVDMKPEEAIKYVVSCGVIIPHEKKS